VRTIINVLVVLVLCVAVVGFFRGWYTFSGPNRDGDGNKINVQLSVDPDKVKADAAQARDKAAELGKGK
jgi:hypothetical protein